MISISIFFSLFLSRCYCFIPLSTNKDPKRVSKEKNLDILYSWEKEDKEGKHIHLPPTLITENTGIPAGGYSRLLAPCAGWMVVPLTCATRETCITWRTSLNICHIRSIWQYVHEHINTPTIGTVMHVHALYIWTVDAYIVYVQPRSAFRSDSNRHKHQKRNWKSV